MFEDKEDLAKVQKKRVETEQVVGELDDEKHAVVHEKQV